MGESRHIGRGTMLSVCPSSAAAQAIGVLTHSVTLPLSPSLSVSPSPRPPVRRAMPLADSQATCSACGCVVVKPHAAQAEQQEGTATNWLIQRSRRMANLAGQEARAIRGARLPMFCNRPPAAPRLPSQPTPLPTHHGSFSPVGWTCLILHDGGDSGFLASLCSSNTD